MLAAAWECFSVLLFTSAVLPAAFSSVYPALLFVGGLALSFAVAPQLAHRGRRGIAILAGLRLAGWLVAVVPLLPSFSAVAPETKSDVRMFVATIGFGLMASGLRHAVYRRFLLPFEPRPSPARMRADLTSQLGESATVVGIVGGHVMLLFSVAFLRTASKLVYRAWWEIVPILAILGTVGFTLAVRPTVRAVLAALRSGSNGNRSVLLAGLSQAEAIPHRLSWINFVMWFTCTTIGVFYFRVGPKSWSWADAAMQVAFGSLFAWGVSFYQRGWHQDTVAPVVARLREWTAKPDDRRTDPEGMSLQRKMLNEFGLPLLFTLTLSLFAAIGLYRSLGAELTLQEDFNAITALCASFLMLVLAVGGVFVRAARRLSEPLSAVASAADRVADGKLDDAVPTVEGPDEVVALAHSVEDMRNALARTIAELRDERASLESNVERRTAELSAALDELKQAQSALVQGERLASIGMLMAGIAHEIYNPLNAIAGSVGSLERVATELDAMLRAYQAAESSLPERVRLQLTRQREQLDIAGALADLSGIHKVVQNATRRSVEIIANLRNFSRAPSEPKPVDLNTSLRETLSLLRHQLKQSEITLNECYGELPLVECREGEVNQVLMNLVTNAVQALASARSDSADAARQIGVRTALDGDSVLLIVTDNGPGVASSLGEKIFEPFVTTKPRGEGTGLGLSISRDIVRRHGGTLSFESPAEGGALFRCRLPVAPCSARSERTPCATVTGDRDLIDRSL